MKNGTITGSTDNQYITPWIQWSSQPNNETNTSMVTATFYLKKNSTYANRTEGKGTWTLTINGLSKSESKTVSLYTDAGDVPIISFSVAVPHNNDGKKSIQITASGGTVRTSYKTTSCSGSVVLDDIPRGSKLGNIEAFVLENGVDIPVTKYSNSFTDALEVSLGNVTIATRSPFQAGKLIFDASECQKAYAQMKTTNSTMFSFLITTRSGKTVIGTNTRTAQGTISEQGRAPSWNTENVLSYKDGRADTVVITGDEHKCIAANNQIIVTLQNCAVANKGASLAENAYTLRIGEQVQYVSAEDVFPVQRIFENITDNTLSLLITDSRGNQSGKTFPLDVIEYQLPTLQVQAVRTDPALTGQKVSLTVQGTYTSWSGLAKANTIQTLQYRVQEYPNGNWSEYRTITPVVTEGQWSYQGTIAGSYALAKRHRIEVAVKDILCDSICGAYVVETATPAIDIDLQRRTVGIGKLHGDDLPEGSLDVAGVIRCAGFSGTGGDNFLINPDFRINQRGKSAYNASGYTVDRWQYREIAGNVVTPTSYGISTNSGIIQYVENVGRYAGQSFTLSGELQNGTIQSVTGTLSSTTVGNSYMQFTLRSNGADCACTLKQGNWKWVKFELGNEATPFKPRPYAQELADCQRYYIRYGYGNPQTEGNSYLPFFDGMIVKANAADIYVHLPVAMRTEPSMSGINMFGLQSANGNTLQDQTITSTALDFMTQNTLVVRVNIANSVFEIGKVAKLYSFQNKCYLEFDAEIY